MKDLKSPSLNDYDFGVKNFVLEKVSYKKFLSNKPHFRKRVLQNVSSPLISEKYSKDRTYKK